MRQINEVVEIAAGLIELTGGVTHMYGSCVQAGSVNAQQQPNGDPACVACELVAVGTLITESRIEQERLSRQDGRR